MYHEVPVERTIEDLYDGSLDDTEITDFISANIEAAQKEYNSVVKKAPKIGTDKARYLQEKKAYQEEVDKAKAKVDYWQAVENERQRITHTSPEELKNAEDELSGEAARKDYRGITTGDEENPTSVEDLVRDFLRGAKITPEDFRKETGLSISEQKKFVGMISKQGKTIARLGEELADYDEWNLGGRFFDGDSNAARGAIIDALLSSRTRGDFKQQDATEEEERYIEAVEQQREQWYYENYHMTYEEYLQYREIVLPELLRKYANFAPDVLYPQFVASFEDAYAAEHSQTNNTENNEQQRNDTTTEEPTTTPGDTVLQTEETNNSRGDSQSEEQPTEVPTGVRSSNENGTLPQSTPTEVDKEPLSEEAAQSLITSMEENAIEDPEIRLTPQTWLETFGINNSIDTPIGKVRMGENQYAKLQDKKRTSEFGMISLTLSDPDVIFVEPSKAKGEDVAERNFSYVFAKTFKRNGNKVKYYTSVTVSIDGLEISVSSHFVNPNKMLNKLMEFNREYTKETLFSNSSEMRLAEHQSDVPDLLPTQENNVSSDSKVTQSSQTKQEKENKFSPTPRKDGESITDYAERVAEEHKAQRTRKEEEAKVDTNPTDAQKEAGNYKKGHVKVDGLNITIEQPKGSIRRGTDANGKQWESEMHNTYGYIRGTESVDGDHIDIFLSDNPTEGNVFVVDQVNQRTGDFDEHKVMYGFNSMEEAVQAYRDQYEDGWKVGTVTEVSREEFKKWVDSSVRKTKPFAEYKSVKSEMGVGFETEAQKPTEENAAPASTQTEENNAHNSEKIMHEQKNVQLQQAINAYENATKFYYQQLKEGKLDKVFESKQWKDVLRKQTELQKVLLQLNSEELKELLKQTTNEDTKKEIKGALDAVLRQEQRSIEYNAVLDKQEPITPIYKEEKKSIAVTEFVETDKKEAEIHPVLTGVYHDNGYVVGTNAHILLARKEDYNKSLEGKITNKKGEVIDGKYPNWRAVVEGETTTNSWGINLDKLHAFVRGVLTKLKADGAKKSTIDSATIAFKDTDGKIIVCNAKTLDKALRGARSIGATEFGNKSETFAHAQTKKGYVVCPTISTYYSINDNCFVYAPKEAARQQTTATLTNDTEAKQKATEAVLAALSKAGIEVVRATDEEVKALLSNSHATTLRTPQGTIYGWSVNGKIYLTEAGLNPDTPIHEYTHLWADAMMKQNKQGWNSIKSLLKDTPVWKEVIADPNYSNIKDNEDAVASEVLSRISGKKNAAKMEEEAQRAIDEAKGVFEKAEAATVLLNLKRALKQFWHWVGKNVFGIKDFKNIDEVTDRVLYDLLSNTKLNSGTVTTVDGVSLPSRINVVEAEANHGFKNFDDGRKWAKENIARTYDNEETNGKGNIRISNTAIDKFMSEKAVAKSESKDVHMAVLKVLPDIIRESVDAEQHEDRIKDENGIRKAGNTVNPDVMIHRLYGAVDIAGKIYRVKVTLKENVRTKETSKAYSYEATKIELLSGQSGDVTMTSPRNDNNSILTAKLLKDIEKSYGKGVKLLKDDKSSDPRFQIVGNSLSDEEKKIVETAKANDTYMKAPNGKPTNLSEKQWAQVRTKAFKNWFGDWEKAARIEKLRRSKAVKITGEEIEPNSDLKQYKKNALEYGKNLRGEYTNKDTGETIALTGGNSRGGMREILQHDYKDIEHLQSIAAIPQIIEKAIFVDEAPNEDAERYPGVKSFRYYVCGLKIGNTYYTVKAVVAVQNNGDRYYDHKLSSIEKGKLLSIIPTIQKAGIENNLPPSVGKDKRLLSILQTNSSKVVDENGEPMVVYHGSNNEFTKFDTARIGSSTGTSDGRGFYFTTDKDYANSFGKDGNVLSVFLNIDNPLSLKEKTITKRQLFDIIKRIDEKEVAADGEHWLISNYANYYDVGIDGAIREAAESEYPYSDNDVELVNSLISASGNFKDVVSSVYEVTGKSSEIVPKENGTVHYVVTNPNQIKSATSNNGNFSTTEDDILYRTVFGGNSGYVGYSMSKRAAEAKEEGRYPKTEFRREYHITAKSLDMLTSLGFIDNSEWHHTSMYGNKTPFYGWAEDELADDYLKHKKEIDTLCKGIDPKTKQPLIEKVEKPQYEYKFELPQYNEAATAANPIIEWRHKQIEKYDQFTGFKGYAYETKEKKKERDAFLHSLNEQMEEKIREMLAKDFPDYLAAKNAIEAYNNYDENLRKAIGERIKEYLDIDKYSQRWREQTATTQPTANVEELTNHAESVVQNLHLNNVEIVPDGSNLNGEQSTAKGFYDKRTGKIVVVASNHTDIADIEKTVLHEAVAHHGLRELFGDNFDNFLDTVFAKADIETRRQIAHLSAKHGWNIRTATEEYLASMAENINFEQIKPTLWQRIKQLFGEIMSAFGLHHANITDNDLRYILWRSYKNLQSSGKHSILDKAEDIAMQYRLKAGNYADKATDNVLYRSGIDPTATEVLPDARTRYEKETKEPDNIDSVPKTHNFFRRFYKSYVDSMLALKSFTNSVLEATGDKMASHEDTYKAENAMTSKNKTDGEVYNPLFPYMPLYLYM
ncbi:ADP-ribosyltransferase-containing protein [Prevotella pallens]|uniref:LPD3 domain-containing protein n=1 Tax=Prevotella pallens TaxID=60133 RepID=UPI00352BEC92